MVGSVPANLVRKGGNTHIGNDSMTVILGNKVFDLARRCAIQAVTSNKVVREVVLLGIGGTAVGVSQAIGAVGSLPHDCGIVYEGIGWREKGRAERERDGAVSETQVGMNLLRTILRGAERSKCVEGRLSLSRVHKGAPTLLYTLESTKHPWQMLYY